MFKKTSATIREKNRILFIYEIHDNKKVIKICYSSSSTVDARRKSKLLLLQLNYCYFMHEQTMVHYLSVYGIRASFNDRKIIRTFLNALVLVL